MMFNAGKQIGSYTLIKRIGRGGFGEVWLAERKSKFVTTKVAVKLPLEEQVDAEAIKSEAVLWEQASGHPNVLPIIDADEYDGQIVIVSEYAPDGSLDDLLQKEGVLPSRRAVELTIGILSGLEFLHSRKIIHRDIKPANILLQGETPRLADFGISRVMKTTSASMNMSGTPSYMAPEAFDRKRTAQTDIWSVGVMLYQMLKGTLPFPYSNITDLLGALFREEPQPLPDSVPVSLQRIVLKSLAKKPEERYQNVRQMRDDLGDFLISISQKNIEKTLVLEKLPETVASVPLDQTQASPTIQTPASLVNTEKLELKVTKEQSENVSTFNIPSLSPGNKRSKNKTSAYLGIGLLILLAMGSLMGFAWWKSTSEDSVKVAQEPKIKEAGKSTDEKAVTLANQALNEVMLGNYSSAHKISKDSLQLDNNLPLALSINYYSNFRLGIMNGDAAIDLTEAVRPARLDPKNALIKAWLAEVYFYVGDNDMAEKTANEVTTLLLNPVTAIDYYAVGKSKYILREADSSIQDFSKSIMKNPQFAEVYVARGNAYAIDKKTDLALKDFTKAIEVNPQFTYAYIERAQFYVVSNQDVNSAIKDLNKAIEISPWHAYLYSLRGNFYQIKEDYNSAIKDLTKAIEIRPQFVSAYSLRAAIYDAMGNKSLANADRQKYKELGGK